MTKIFWGSRFFFRVVLVVVIVVLFVMGLLLPSAALARNGSNVKRQSVNSLWHDVPYDIFIQQAFSNTNGVTQDFYYHSFSVPLNSATVGRFFIVSYTPDVGGSEFYASVLSGAGASGIFSSPGSPIYSNSIQAYCFLDSAAFGWNGWAYIGDTAMLNYCDTVAAEMNWTGSVSKYWSAYGSGTTAPIVASLGGFSSQTYRYVSWYNGGSGQIWSLPIFFGEPPVYATSTPTVTPTSLYTPLPTFTFVPTVDFTQTFHGTPFCPTSNFFSATPYQFPTGQYANSATPTPLGATPSGAVPFQGVAVPNLGASSGCRQIGLAGGEDYGQVFSIEGGFQFVSRDCYSVIPDYNFSTPASLFLPAMSFSTNGGVQVCVSTYTLPVITILNIPIPSDIFFIGLVLIIFWALLMF